MLGKSSVSKYSEQVLELLADSITQFFLRVTWIARNEKGTKSDSPLRLRMADRISFVSMNSEEFHSVSRA